MIEDFKILNIEKVLQNKKLPNWVLKAAFEIRQSEFLPAGEYFEKLDDVEVYEIKNSLDYINTKNFEHFEVYSEQAKEDLQNLSLLCFILALGEGEVEISAGSLSSMLEYLFLLITVENAHREGKVEAIRENYSLFGGNKPVVKPKE